MARQPRLAGVDTGGAGSFLESLLYQPPAGRVSVPGLWFVTFSATLAAHLVAVAILILSAYVISSLLFAKMHMEFEDALKRTRERHEQAEPAPAKAAAPAKPENPWRPVK